MPYKCVKNLLDENPNPELYDLKFEKPYSLESNMERVLAYKFSHDGFDCDGSGEGNERDLCGLIREVYRILWGWNDKEGDGKVKRYAPCCISGEILFGPETMNSFWTSFGAYMNNPQLIKTGKYEWKRNTVLFSENKKMSKNEREKKIFDEAPGDVEKSSDKDNLKEFAQMVGCLGNMTLTFKGNNQKIANDYWDIKLDKQILRKNDRGIGIKNKFINLFFQWDYVYVKDGAYCFKPFYNGHSENNSFPSEVENLESYFDKVNKYILRRGIFMVAMLRIESIDHNIYETIRNGVLLSEDTYGDYKDVIEKIEGLEIMNKEIISIINNLKIYISCLK